MSKLNVLLARTDRIGDVLLSLPVAEAVKQSFPQARVDFVVQEYTAPVCEMSPAVDNLILSDEKDVPELTDCFRRGNYDLYIALYPQSHISYAAFRAEIPRRVGTGFRLHSVYYNKKVFEHRKTVKKHETEYNLSLLKSAGIDCNEVIYRIHVPETAQAEADAMLKDLSIGDTDPFVILHPGSGGSALDWPWQKFAELAGMIGRERKFKILLTGTEKEKRILQSVQRTASGETICLDTPVSLTVLAGIINRCRCLIANSTGPLHVANALHKPVVGLYPPVKTMLPERWGPYGKPGSVLVPDIPVMKKRPKENDPNAGCMELIAPEKVFEKIACVMNDNC